MCVCEREREEREEGICVFVIERGGGRESQRGESGWVIEISGMFWRGAK